MKRFLLFLVVAIAIVSLGLTIYYFSVDNEMIYIKSSYLVVNAGKSFNAEGENGLLDFRNRADSTTLTYSVDQEDEDDKVLEFLEKEKIFRPIKGGEAKIVIKTNNRSYSRLVIDVLVCDGTENYPYMVNNEEELLQRLTANECCKLNNDVEITANWKPISFDGMLDGNHHSIKGLKITDNELTNTVDVGFISILGGTIKNLKLVDVDYNVSKAVTLGAFAGRVNKGTIQTSEATGTLKNTNETTSSKVGGVAGNIASNSKIDRCGFDGTIDITGSSITAGGIVGANNNSRISESYARETVNNGTYTSTIFGGIAGESMGADANIYDCYFYAKQEPTRNSASEIAGIVFKTDSKSTKALITGCYYGGKMKAIGGSSTSGLVNNGELISTSNGYLNDTATGFKDYNKFITYEKISTNEKRTWNFNGVWTLGAEDYPILNTESSVGSDYNFNDSEITTTDRIYNAETFYEFVKDNKECVVKGTLDMKNYVWKVITEFDDGSSVFNNKIIGEDNAVVKNFTIDATDCEDTFGIVGLVDEMGSNARINNITFENINIITTSNQKFDRVGVLAGVSNGAQVNNVKIRVVDVNVTGVCEKDDSSFYGTLFGTADSTTVIDRVLVEDVDVTDGYFTMAGGFIGAGYAMITASGSLNSSKLYNYANNIKLVSSYAGGFVGANGGSISYSTANNIQYNNEGGNSSSIYTNQIYKSGLNKAFAGGIVGTNEYKVNGSIAKGTILDVYSCAFNLKASSTVGYKLYFGGIAGSNSNDITRAYVKSANMVVSGSHNAFVGGITGYNSGKINNSVVDADSRISTNIVASVGTSTDKGNYILNTDNCTIVGGIVGYDTVTTNNSCSIYKSATYMKEIKGYYAGGISGISFGKVQFSYCGETSKDNGGVTITGFLGGGLASVVAGGYMKNCYTICRLNAIDYGKYQNILSVIKMEVSAVGGLTVFALNGGTSIESCYCVATFNRIGASYGSSADLTGIVCGTIKNCVYQTAGSAATRNGTKLTQSNMKGSPNYSAFKNAIQGNLAYWDFPSSSGYPTISGVNVNFPSSSIPVFH